MKELFAFIFVLIVLAFFNSSYLANCGILVPKLFWDQASVITDKNAFTHPHSIIHSQRKESDPLNIADFRFEPFYTEEDAKKLVNRVLDQKHLWERRNIAMSTLGTSSYVDGAIHSIYVQKSAESNPTGSSAMISLASLTKRSIISVSAKEHFCSSSFLRSITS